MSQQYDVAVIRTVTDVAVIKALTEATASSSTVILHCSGLLCPILATIFGEEH